MTCEEMAKRACYFPLPLPFGPAGAGFRGSMNPYHALRHRPGRCPVCANLCISNDWPAAVLTPKALCIIARGCLILATPGGRLLERVRIPAAPGSRATNAATRGYGTKRLRRTGWCFVQTGGLARWLRVTHTGRCPRLMNGRPLGAVALDHLGPLGLSPEWAAIHEPRATPWARCGIRTPIDTSLRALAA